MSKTVVVLDSSALIAQINGKDIWHKKADAITAFIAQTERHVILPSEVFAETLNRIGNNIGRQAAVRAGRALLARHAAGDLLGVRSGSVCFFQKGAIYRNNNGLIDAHRVCLMGVSIHYWN
jgi:predicted nucleic acid-binding protein